MKKGTVMGHLKAYEGKFRSILLFGPPGSGKGTQGRLLASAGNHVHLSTGDIFRGLAPESPMGKLFYKYANRGHLLPDETTVEIWAQYVLGLIATNRYYPDQQILLLDGIPRTLDQASMLESHIEILAIVLLESSHPETLIQRMLRRATIERRSDDQNESVLKRRFEVYEKETTKLMDRYPSSLIHRFNAEQRPLEVLRDILENLAEILSV